MSAACATAAIRPGSVPSSPGPPPRWGSSTSGTTGWTPRPSKGRVAPGSISSGCRPRPSRRHARTGSTMAGSGPTRRRCTTTRSPTSRRASTGGSRSRRRTTARAGRGPGRSPGRRPEPGTGPGAGAAQPNPLAGPNVWPAAAPGLATGRAALVRQGERLRGRPASRLCGGGRPRPRALHPASRPAAQPGVAPVLPDRTPVTPAKTGSGSPPHTDFGMLTVLAQDDVGGLEIQRLGGEWVAMPPLPGTLVVNVGDLLERWSNRRYRSTVHRVINRSGRERLSLVLAYDPELRDPGRSGRVLRRGRDPRTTEPILLAATTCSGGSRRPSPTAAEAAAVRAGRDSRVVSRAPSPATPNRHRRQRRVGHPARAPRARRADARSGGGAARSTSFSFLVLGGGLVWLTFRGAEAMGYNWQWYPDPPVLLAGHRRRAHLGAVDDRSRGHRRALRLRDDPHPRARTRDGPAADVGFDLGPDPREGLPRSDPQHADARAAPRVLLRDRSGHRNRAVLDGRAVPWRVRGSVRPPRSSAPESTRSPADNGRRRRASASRASIPTDSSCCPRRSP